MNPGTERDNGDEEHLVATQLLCLLFLFTSFSTSFFPGEELAVNERWRPMRVRSNQKGIHNQQA